MLIKIKFDIKIHTYRRPFMYKIQMFQEDTIILANLKEDIFITYYKKFIDDDSHNLFNFFESSIVYNKVEDSMITIYGKKIPIPRKQVAFGEKGTTYTFSGVTVEANDWNQDNLLCKVIKILCDKVAKRFNYEPNFVLINRYEGGNQYIGYHSDDEKDLDQKSPIAGISFGAEREILFKHKTNDKCKIKSLLLKNGSAYCMHYPTNKFYAHSIPKKSGINGIRISFTFRQMTKK